LKKPLMFKITAIIIGSGSKRG